MFTTISQPAPFTRLFSHHHTSQPHNPSPLAPRHANLTSSQAPTTMPMSHSKPQSPRIEHKHTHKQEKSTTTRATSPKQSYYADRYANNSPKAQLARQKASREQQRRDIFLNRVKRDRDEGRFDARSEQIQRINYLAQQRRYQEAIARSAPDVGPLMEEVEDGGGEGEGGGMVFDDGAEGLGGVEDERILEEFISQEEEYQAFLEELEPLWDIEQQSQQGDGPPSSQYDDEEDYENIFAELLIGDDDQDNQHQHTISSDQNDSMHDRMDMSCG
ncbi:hypothetical protein BDBG_03147 [Blastomyces gilchristii SLH14081]|uniref:Uncharacterized protein n=2 Tax=Blastomyces TaxID=229219 RepID=A0A179UKW2_BLAGS|nr:uncharacterized protein BDBG_03147 [Blastomyces gilchristii SLH14081]EGE79894.1 hypothetical protein BDDG_02835 [Blastomyces dermatitidis ATCC 18188]OAT07042.1 hypothetical protein BDBG_03147 [Blastomyces gilchristii SLH14081]